MLFVLLIVNLSVLCKLVKQNTYLGSGRPDRERVNRVMVVGVASIARRHGTRRFGRGQRFTAATDPIVTAERPVLRLLVMQNN